jgi:hypothetical protein
MWRLERVWEEQNRTAVLVASAGIILAVAFADWWTKPFVAFGVLYLFPIMLAAGFLPRWAIALIGLGCAVLSEVFNSLEPSSVRLAFETLALVGWIVRGRTRSKPAIDDGRTSEIEGAGRNQSGGDRDRE